MAARTCASQDDAAFDPAQGRATYLFNATIAGIERADALLIIGSNPRREAAVLNARIRKRWRAGKFPIALIGEKVDLTYPYDYLGAGPDTLAELVAGKHSFAEMLKGAEHPLIIVGAGALARPDGAAVAALAAKAAIELGAVKEGWNGYSVLHTAASRVGALEIGFVPGEGALGAAAMAKPGALDVHVPPRRRRDRRAAGRVHGLYRHPRRQRRAPRRRDPAGRGLSGKIRPLRQHRRPRADGQPRELPARRCPRGLGDPARAVGRAGREAALQLAAGAAAALFKERPQLARIGQIVASGAADIRQLSALKGDLDKAPFRRCIDDYYLTNPIARASAVMAECSALAEGRASMTAAE